MRRSVRSLSVVWVVLIRYPEAMYLVLTHKMVACSSSQDVFERAWLGESFRSGVVGDSGLRHGKLEAVQARHEATEK